MLQTYKARLHGTQVEWLGEIPSELHDGQDVHITLLEENSLAQPTPSKGQQMAAILKELALLNTTASIDDPVAWQRETRTDKPLDRDEV
jgi:cytolysin (calcineurin-like family phosphatase)